MRDPIMEALYDREYKEEKKLSMRPVCEVCEKPIQDSEYYETDSYDTVCENCLWELFHKWRKDNKILID